LNSHFDHSFSLRITFPTCEFLVLEWYPGKKIKNALNPADKGPLTGEREAAITKEKLTAGTVSRDIC
jgi:hypothetical protein